MSSIDERLDYLRGEIEAERISLGELVELEDLYMQGLIPEHDLVLREWAGDPENLEPTDEFIIGSGFGAGRKAYRYEVRAYTAEIARARIPGDFLVHDATEIEPGLWVIEIVRTF